MKSWYSIRAAATDSSIGEISIHDEIGFWGVNSDTFVKDLKALGPVQTIRLSINSPCGDVFAGWHIYHALKMHPARVEATVMGVAASMASVVAMAADTITMPLGAQMMIHNPVGLVFGEAKDMEHMAGLLSQIREDIVQAYANRTGLPTDEIVTMMDATTWMNGSIAHEKGFCDICDTKLAAAAVTFDNALLKNMPTIVATADPAVPPVEPTAPEVPAATPPPADPVEPPAPDPAPAADPPPADPSPQGFVARAVAALKSLVPGGNLHIEPIADPTGLRAQLDAAIADRDSINAKLSAAEAELVILRPKAQERDELEKLLADKRQIIADAAAAHGLTPAEAENLPAPKSGSGDILAEFESITDPGESNAFYKKHRAQIEALKKTR